MTFDEYQDATSVTAKYPGQGVSLGLLYCVLGMCGEAGEVAEKVKKKLRKFGDDINNECEQLPWTEQDKDDLTKELGDVIWYVARACLELGISFDHVAAMNLKKLMDRKERGVICGEGDNR